MWRFQLCNSGAIHAQDVGAYTDDMTLIGELFGAKDFGLELILNRPGTLRFTMPLSDELATSVKEGETCIQAWRDNNAGTQVCRWSGPVWSVEENLVDRTMTVSAVGWFEELNHRIIRLEQESTARYTDMDAGAIVLSGLTSLLGLANVQSWRIQSSGWAGLDMRYPTHITAGTYDSTVVNMTGNTVSASDTLTIPGGTASLAIGMPVTGAGIPAGTTIDAILSSTTVSLTANATATATGVTLTITLVPRTRSYARWSNIGQAIQELSDVENGFDFEVDPLTRKLNLYFSSIKAGSTLKGKGTDRPNALFMMGWGASNLSSLSVNSDMASVANRVTVSGANALATVQDDASYAKYGFFEEQVSLSDANATGLILQAYGMAELAVRSNPRPMYSLAPFPWTPDGNVPRLFDDYNLGDIVYLRAKGGRKNIGDPNPQAVRIFGVSLGIDAEGNETISAIQTNPQS